MAAKKRKPTRKKRPESNINKQNRLLREIDMHRENIKRIRKRMKDELKKGKK